MLAIQEQTQDEICARSLIISGLSEFADTSNINKVLEVIHITRSLLLLQEDIESVTRLGSTIKQGENRLTFGTCSSCN